MKKIASSLLILPLLVFTSLTNKAPSSSSSKDTLIVTPIYKSLYSKDYNMTRRVSYKLYKAGGECSRTAEGMAFRLDDIRLKISGKDYSHSGYDMGHMANAEDFSYDCKMEELTFRFYNCVPQSPKSNRGIWKSYESKIRKLSQTDSVFVMCGPVIDKDTKRLNSTRLFVPTRTWKVVYSLSTKKIVYCLIFDNDNVAAKVNEISVTDLQKLVGLDLSLKAK